MNSLGLVRLDRNENRKAGSQPSHRLCLFSYDDAGGIINRAWKPGKSIKLSVVEKSWCARLTCLILLLNHALFHKASASARGRLRNHYCYIRPIFTTSSFYPVPFRSNKEVQLLIMYTCSRTTTRKRSTPPPVCFIVIILVCAYSKDGKDVLWNFSGQNQPVSGMHTHALDVPLMPFHWTHNKSTNKQ